MHRGLEKRDHTYHNMIVVIIELINLIFIEEQLLKDQPLDGIPLKAFQDDLDT